MAPPPGYNSTVAGLLYALGASAIMATFLVIGAHRIVFDLRAAAINVF